MTITATKNHLNEMFCFDDIISDENEIFGEVSSSEDEEDDREVNIMDSGDESQLVGEGGVHAVRPSASMVDDTQDTMDSMAGDMMPLPHSPASDLINCEYADQ